MLLGALAVIILSTAMTILGPRESLDAKFYYTGEQAHALLLSFTAEEAEKYFRNEIIDLLFIVAYTSLLFMALKKRAPNFIWLAFPAGFFDLIETSSILYCLKASPVFLNQLGFVTAFKWIFFTGAKLTVLYGLFRAKLKGRSRTVS